MNRHHGLWTLLVAAAAAFASWTSPDALHAQQEQIETIRPGPPDGGLALLGPVPEQQQWEIGANQSCADGIDEVQE